MRQKKRESFVRTFSITQYTVWLGPHFKTGARYGIRLRSSPMRSISGRREYRKWISSYPVPCEWWQWSPCREHTEGRTPSMHMRLPRRNRWNQRGDHGAHAVGGRDVLDTEQDAAAGYDNLFCRNARDQCNDDLPISQSGRLE